MGSCSGCDKEQVKGGSETLRIAFQAKYLILIFCSVFVIFLDQLTKHLVLENFNLGEVKTMIPEFFNITFIRNPGAAFGFLSSLPSSLRGPFFIVVPLIALFGIGYVFFRLPHSDRKCAFALSLITGGAIGNFIDRIQFQWVVDWLDFHFRSQYHYPAFNLADAGICLGVGILILDHIREPISSHETLLPIQDVQGRQVG